MPLQIISISLTVVIFIVTTTISVKQKNFDKKIRIAEDNCLINKQCDDIKVFIDVCKADKKCNKKLKKYYFKKYVESDTININYRVIQTQENEGI